MNKKNEVLEYLERLEILYVEDDEHTREELEYFLQKRVKKLYVAKNGEEGLALFKKHKPELVITDIQMPIIDGIKLAKEIKILDKEVPIILLTAFNDVEYLFEAIKLNINYYLTKPLNLRILVDDLVEISKKISMERKNKEIYNTLEQYKDIVDETSLVFKMNCEGIVTYVNNRFEDVSKYGKDEIIGKSFNKIHDYLNEEDIFSEIYSHIKKGNKFWKKRIKNLTKDLKPYIVDMTVKAILDLDGNILELICLSNDITDLENSKEYFKSLTQKSADDLSESIRISNAYKEAIYKSNILIKVDLNKIITYVNDEFCRVLGYSRADLMGQPYTILKQPNVSEDEFNLSMEKYFSGEIYKGPISNYSKDGKILHFKIITYPLKDKDGNIIEFLGIRHDITKIEELHKELVATQEEIICKLGEIGETRSSETGYHVKRVAEYSKLLGKKIGLNEKEISTLSIASPMHDIGKIGIPDAILNKNGKLDKEEWRMMQKHSQIGYDILNSSNREILKAAAQISYTHHEKWDGSGYPQGLSENNIPIFGRITAIADVFDALGSNRVYKKAWELDKILEFFKNERGKHFDPKLIDIFFDNLDNFLEIKEKYKD